MMKTYNPTGITNIGDPFILIANGKHYMYATSFCQGFNCWVSDDLETWSQPIVCYKKSERSFGYADFWAPEVIFHNNKYYMHYSARWDKNASLRIGVAVSDQPEGPFIDIMDKKPMFDFGYAAIDGHVFKDEDGKFYFYYSRDCSEHIVNGYHESHIYGVELADDLMTFIGDPVMIIKPEKDYERRVPSDEGAKLFRWNEGPFIVKKEDGYHLMYSANFYADKHYCICCATSKHPLKDFEKYDEPVLTYVENKVSGPGHNSVFIGRDGELYTAYHVHTYYDKPSGNRQMFIDNLYFENGKIKIAGPTYR